MPETKEKLVLSTRDFYYIVQVEDIIFCKSENSYTTFYLVNGEEIKVSVSIKNIEKTLDSNVFVRPHQSYLVNVQHIKYIRKNNKGDMVLNNGKTITISSRRKNDVLNFLSNIKQIKS